MVQEEHTQMCSNSSSGGGDNVSNGCCGGGPGGSSSSSRSSKKLKQKKVPQRGLGVAQLEKIRIEEQQKKDVVVAMLSPNLFVPPSNFRHNPSLSSTPLPPPLSPTDGSSPNPIFRPVSSTPIIDLLQQNSITLSKDSKPSNGGAEETGWSAISGLDHHEFCTTIWPPTKVMQRTKQFQEQPLSPSMVNVSSRTSSSASSSSSVINFHQIEPPSNQSFYGNNYAPLWQEEKIVGMKRPYPFSLDNLPGPSFPTSFPPTYVPPIARSDESASFCNGGSVNVEPSNPVFRKGLPWSSIFLSDLNPKKVAKGIVDFDGDFLTLAPPTTAEAHPCSNYKHSLVNLTPIVQELSEFEYLLPFQGSAEDPIHRPGPSVMESQQQPFYSFFPLENTQIGQEPITGSSSSGVVGENVDLNLKL